VNAWPTGSTASSLGVSVISFASGHVTVFDTAGNPVPVQLPDTSVQVFDPFSLLGSNPGTSVIYSLVVSNLSTFASSEDATIVKSYGSPGGDYNPPAGTSMEELSVAATADESQNSTWTYYYSNGYWIADAMTTYPKFSAGTTSQTAYYQNVAWHDNSSADSTRAGKTNTAQAPAVPSTGTPGSLSSVSSPSCGTQVTNLGGSQNVLFQHGLFSNSCAWTRMTGWLNQDFLFGTEVVPSLDSTASLSSQATSLENEIKSVGGNGYLLLGHSQGGLIARAAAQYLQANAPGKTTGVATVDSPNEGALLDLNTYGLVYEAEYDAALSLWDTTGCYSAYDNWSCFMAALTASGAGFLGDYALASNIPATADLVPGSAFLTQLNGGSENFIRAGVVSYTPQRWAFMRLLASKFFGCYPEQWCGERAVALYTEIFYDTLYVAEVISIIYGDYTLAGYFIAIQHYMNVADHTWNNLVALPGQGSDAIVQAPSQNYPSSTATQYSIQSADSHLGATKSNHVRDALYNALVHTFGVPTPASCSFSLSPGSFSTSSSGASGSFTVSTGGGCKWSAVSNVDWVNITGGSSGTSNGTVSFSVLANSVAEPRSGTLTVGNGESSTNFTVRQSALCGYGLSNYTVSIPPGGGTATVDVYASEGLGCPWSAVPNATWLSITSGASGTDNGSFTLSASSNTGNTSLLGTVTVMSQTLDVVLGDPMGTPGTGSVTINGSPKSTYVCRPGCSSCLSKSCVTLVYESGTVGVTIGGDYYYANYSGTETGGQIASALASAINSGGLVSASASGSTITLIAKVKGSNTNYSLSTSYSYDTTFTAPAFTASASGTAMTGGTN
jgi:pimeloyl-ACP methyl ester carboxylesterase